MTGPVLAFNASTTKGVKLKRITPAQVPVETPVQAASPVEARFSAQALARAETASLFAGLLGVALQKTDLLEQLTAETGDDLSADAIARALGQVGLVTSLATPRELTAKLWPALAEMVNGEIVLVMRQEGDILTVYDATQNDSQVEVDLAAF